MSAADLIESAAAGTLPEWAEAGPERRAHLGRVAALMDDWAMRLGLAAGDRVRWRAAAWLHDALRDGDPDAHRTLVSADQRDFPGPLLHGPAAAARLEAEGVTDRALLMAVAFHTLGHPALDLLGRALYLADFLEPGRSFSPLRRATLRARMPGSFDAVLIEVVAARIGDLIRSRRTLRPETSSFWNDVSGGG